MKKPTRADIHAKLNGHCSYCGDPITIAWMQVDHMIPKSDFMGHRNRGNIPIHLLHVEHPDHPDNLYPSCRVCNKWKSFHSLDFFRSEIAEQLNRLNNYSSNYRMAKKYGLVQETPKPVKFYFEQIEEAKRIRYVLEDN